MYNNTLDSKSKTAIASRIYGQDNITKTKPKESFKTFVIPELRLDKVSIKE